ncbi:hypothetical protein DPF_0401 [Desulfoplanes formicivorans]|uniref:Uncharacterized protein n=1 Tax=Desulfoplanes formicivorans TaxID=1592317 RepID=A0A194AET6_9BACT|nr:hypothetical protein DPF_0401 [Desulfoplanes formicivorans]
MPDLQEIGVSGRSCRVDACPGYLACKGDGYIPAQAGTWIHACLSWDSCVRKSVMWWFTVFQKEGE